MMTSIARCDSKVALKIYRVVKRYVKVLTFVVTSNGVLTYFYILDLAVFCLDVYLTIWKALVLSRLKGHLAMSPLNANNHY